MDADVSALLGPERAPPGALRIIARNNDREVLIVHGEERALGEGERLAAIEWFPSIAVAEAISHECSRLLIASHIPMSRGGWHAYPVEHLHKLIRVARNHLNFTYHPPEPARERQNWTGERIARLAYLAGQGWTAKMIASDPLIRSTENNVFVQAHRLNVPLSAISLGQLTLRRLPAATMGGLERGAAQQGITREAYAARLVIEAFRPGGEMAVAS